MDKAIGNAELRRWIVSLLLAVILIPVSAYA